MKTNRWGITWPPPTAPRRDGDTAYPSLWNGTEGMSLRDWFAGQALNGNLPAYSAWTNRENFTAKQVAIDAYAIAEAMLAERLKR